jgi:hypothetical protein
MQARVLSLGFQPTTFEVLAVNLSVSRINVLFLVIYRPGSEAVKKTFFSDLTTVLEKVSTYNCQIVVTGDLNIHLDIPTDPNTILLNDLLQSFGLCQLVHEATHSGGHTLDVVITRSDLQLPEVTVDPCRLSDHHPMTFQLNLERPPIRLIDIDTRAWRGFKSDEFRSDLLASKLCMQAESYEQSTVDELQEIYDTELVALLEKHAPKRTARKRYQPLTPWFDSDCSAAKRKTRLFERRYRRTRTGADRQLWTNQIRIMHRLYIEKQNSYWSNKVSDSHRCPKKLWKTLSSILCREKKISSQQSTISADDFSRAFASKVQNVRTSTQSASPPDFTGVTSASTFEQFHLLTVDDSIRLVKRANNKCCALDPAPTWIVKQYVDDLAPFITILINRSIRSGQFPSSQKCAMVTPLLKKETLDPCDLGNYRPVSNLSFLSKILERAVYDQVSSYLQEYNLLPERQSAYRKHHSTETALLDVLSDVYAASDSGKLTLLGLLDQSAAFDVVDHEILLQRLEHCFGLTATVLAWMTSYLSDRTQFVNYNGRSEITVIQFGVPQGSVLGPLLYVLYTSEIYDIIEGFGLHVHGYADDLQIYDYVFPQNVIKLVDRFSACVCAIMEWMKSNRLCLNPGKTELIWLSSPRRVHLCPSGSILIAGSWIKPATSVRDLGVILDNGLTMIPHVNKLISLCYFNIRQLRTIRRSLTSDASHSLVRALIHSRLDYCNGVLSGLPDYMFGRLQSVLKASARLVLKKPPGASTSSAMINILHWLPFPQRVLYKTAVMTYKCLNNLAPTYLSRRFTSVSEVPGRAMLRSNTLDRQQLIIPKTNTLTIGPRGFYFSGAHSWNNLPISLRDNSMSLATFKKHLKTALFPII